MVKKIQGHSGASHVTSTSPSSESVSPDAHSPVGQVGLGKRHNEIVGPETQQKLTGVGRPMTPNAKRFTAQHDKSRLQKADGYPDRNHGTPVPAGRALWGIEYPDYAPVEFTHAAVSGNWNEHQGQPPKGWAGPPTANAQRAQGPFESFTGEVKTASYDGDERPLNPMGRTGISGRGLLGKWGANFAGDPIVTRKDPDSGQLEMVAILRDSGEWAIPGGMVDKGEDIFKTLAREFKEEAGEDIDFSDASKIYTGYADDPRNTDNAWMETQVFHKHLPDEVAARLDLVAGDDAKAVRWMPLTAENVDQLYGNHAAFVKLALEQLPG